MAKVKEEEGTPNPNEITDEQREYAAAVHKALTGGGKFPPGHEFAGMTKQEVIDRENEARQRPREAAAPPPVVAHGAATGESSKKDAAAKRTG